MRTITLGLMLLFLMASAFAGEKTEIEIIDSDTTSKTYDVPARAACLPGAQGLTCGYRGAETIAVGYVILNAKINGVDVVLTCSTSRDKHCARFRAGKHVAEPKGKDEIVLYGWGNPMYQGDLSKATKVKFHVSYKVE